MDVTKTIKDAGYIAVGAGVIGFQQAQVRRRELGTEIGRRAGEARGCAERTLESLRSELTDRSADVRNGFQDQAQGAWDAATQGIAGVTSTIGDTAASIGDTAASTASSVATSSTSFADDVRELVEPVIGEARIRVEPFVEQLQTVPGQVVKAVDAGRTRVLGLVGSTSGSPATAA